MLLASLVVGFLAGLAYFAGLWWTAKRVPRVRAVAPFMIGSFLVRMALLMMVVFGVSRGAPVPVVVALLGVWLARQVTFAYVRRGGAAKPG